MRHKLSLYGCLVFSSYVRQLIVRFLNRGSGKTAFLHPIGYVFQRSCKYGQVCQLVEPPLCVHSFSATRRNDISFVEKIFQLCQVVMGAHKFKSIQQGIVFVCVKISEPSVFYILQNETKSQIHFRCTFQIVEKMIKFLVHDCFVESFHCLIDYFVSRSSKFRIHQEMLTGTQLFSHQPVILNIFHYVFQIHISCS